MMTQSITERDEYLHEQWEGEFANSALAVLVENAMDSCPLRDRSIGGREFTLRLALGAAFETEISLEQRITWASKLSGEVLDFEDFVERESGEDEL